MICKKCGREIPDYARLCINCGSKVYERVDDIYFKNPSSLEHADLKRPIGPERLEGKKKDITIPILIGSVSSLFLIMCILAAVIIARPKLHNTAKDVKRSEAQTSYIEDETDASYEEDEADYEEDESEDADVADDDSEDMAEEDSDDEETGDFQSTEASVFDGNAKVWAVDVNPDESTITLRIENNTDDQTHLFDIPVQVINGESTYLNPYANMMVTANTAAPGSYVDVPLVVDEEMFESGGKINGSLFSMGYYSGDGDFEIEISK